MYFPGVRLCWLIDHDEPVHKVHNEDIPFSTIELWIVHVGPIPPGWGNPLNVYWSTWWTVHIQNWSKSNKCCESPSMLFASGSNTRCSFKDLARISIGASLWVFNHYSGLHTLVAGINTATYSGDLFMEIFRWRALEAYKSYQSWDLLF